jgi:hypothetical protein
MWDGCSGSLSSTKGRKGDRGNKNTFSKVLKLYAHSFTQH